MRKLIVLLACLFAVGGAEARPRSIVAVPTPSGFNGGGASINTNTAGYYYGMHRELNHWTGGDQIRLTSSTNGLVIGKAAWDALGASGQPYFDANTGELNTPVQTDVTSYGRGFFTDPTGSAANPVPNGVYGPPNVGSSGPQGRWWLGQVWNIEWIGTLSTGGSKITIPGFSSLGTGGSPGLGVVGDCGTNCVTLTFGNATGAVNVAIEFVIDASNRNDPPRNIKVYPAQFVTQARSADLTTRLFNPDWIAQWGAAGKSGIGKVRWLDPLGTNYSAITDFSQLAEYTFDTFSVSGSFSGAVPGAVYPPGTNRGWGPKGGIGPQTICLLQNKIGAHAHFLFSYAFTTSAAFSTGQAFNGCMNSGLVVEYEYCNELFSFGFHCYSYNRRLPYPPLGVSAPFQQALSITSITPGNPTTINVASNPYVNGDQIAFSISTSDTISTVLNGGGTNPVGPFTVASAGPTSFTVSANSTGLSYSSGGTVFTVDGSGGVRAGYNAARLMDQIYAAYGASNRSRWKGLLGAQLEQNATLLQNAITGAMFYITNESVGTGACAPKKCFQELFDKGVIAPYAGNSVYNGTQLTALNQNVTPTATAPGHTFINGQVIRCYATTGMTQLNNLTATVSGVSGANFNINIDTSGFSPWTAGNGNFCIDNALPKAADDSIALNGSTPATYPTKYSYFAEQMSDATINGTSVSNPSFGYAVQSSGNWRSLASCGVSCMPGILQRNALKAKSYGMVLDEYEGANFSTYSDTNGQTNLKVTGNSAVSQLYDFFQNWQYDAGTATKGPADIVAAHIANSQAAGVPYPSTYNELGNGPGPFAATRYAGDNNPAISRMYTQNALGPYTEPYTPPAWTATYPGNATNKYTASGPCANCTEGPPANTVVIGTAATTAIVIVTQQAGSVTSVACDGVSSSTPIITNATSLRATLFVLSLNAGANARTCTMTTSGAGGFPRAFYVATVNGLQSTTPVNAIASNPNGTFPVNYTGGNLLVAASACGSASGAWANTSGLTTPTAANPVTTTIALDSDNPNKAQFLLARAPFSSPIFSVAPSCNDSSVAATFR